MIKTKKQMFTVISAFALILLLGTVTYAFFNYTRTGLANTISTGQINFSTTQASGNNNSIDLSNMFPIDPEEENIMNDATKVGTVTIHVTGDTTYDEGVEYLVSAVNVQNTVNNKTVPISIAVSVTSNTGNNPSTTLGEADNDYFTDRGSSSETSIYRVLAEDTINTDDMLVVGYIKSGSTGVDGNVVIKAYLDENKIAISDTYYENVTTTPTPTAPNDEYGTPASFGEGRTVLTTTEWNSLQTNGVSFQVKVEANEGTWVEPPLGAYGDIRSSADTTTLIDFGQISSSSNGEGLYILPGTSTNTYPIYYYRGAVTDNNVIFGGFCWQMVRTTETGGIKMIYNGVATDNGTTCTNSHHVSRIMANLIAFNSNSKSMADIGYMNNTRYVLVNDTASSESIYGKDIEWDGNNYLVIENTAHTASTNSTLDNEHHYTCGISEATTCSTVRYYFYSNNYITLSSGDTIEDAIYKMTGNGSEATKTKNAGYNLNANNSTIKGVIDNWFRENLTNEVDNTKTNYSVYLEDTVYCNDRSFKTVTGNANHVTYEESGWNPAGGDLTKPGSPFGTLNRYNNSNWYSTTNVPAVKNTGEIPNIACPNETDRFTVSSTNGNGALTYPVGLLTADEVIMAGANGNSDTNNNTYYLYTQGPYWSLSPYTFIRDYGAFNSNVDNYGYLSGHDNSIGMGVRPVVSLKLGTEFETGGAGTPTNPYVVKYN